jgi:hypothetical protein
LSAQRTKKTRHCAVQYSKALDQTSKQERNPNDVFVRTVLVVSGSRLHGNFVAGRLQRPDVREGIPPEALREPPVSLRPQFRHVDVDSGASPSRNAQRFAAMRVVIDHGADAIDVLVSLWLWLWLIHGIDKYAKHAKRTRREQDKGHGELFFIVIGSLSSFVTAKILTSCRKKLSYSSFNEEKSVAAIVAIDTAVNLPTSQN